MGQLTAISPAQYEVLNMLSCLTQEEDITALKNVIVQFLNSRLQNKIDRLWENGNLTEEKVAQWSHEHMRTPYRQVP
ncbi:MAG: dephospho-CoA kinase [Bacteroidales bacterium]|nr:dephospho-CoA kinase [Bacteroidales bacterium]